MRAARESLEFRVGKKPTLPFSGVSVGLQGFHVCFTALTSSSVVTDYYGGRGQKSLQWQGISHRSLRLRPCHLATGFSAQKPETIVDISSPEACGETLRSL
jgi:hypothetical protein